MKQLTRAEEQIMQVIWKKKEAMLKDIVDALPSPKPHMNTVGTILKILIEKEFVKATPMGRANIYSAAVTKENYSKGSLKTLVKGYFGGDFTSAVSFMVKENNISIDDLELLLKELKNKK